MYILNSAPVVSFKRILMVAALIVIFKGPSQNLYSSFSRDCSNRLGFRVQGLGKHSVSGLPQLERLCSSQSTKPACLRVALHQGLRFVDVLGGFGLQFSLCVCSRVHFGQGLGFRFGLRV